MSGAVRASGCSRQRFLHHIVVASDANGVFKSIEGNPHIRSTA